MKKYAPIETTPYIYLQPSEFIGRADCGCLLDDGGEDGPALYRCENCIRAVNSHTQLVSILKKGIKVILDVEADADNKGLDLDEARAWWQDADKLIEEFQQTKGK